MARRVLFWAYADAREVVEFPDGTTDAEVDEAMPATGVPPREGTQLRFSC